MNGDSREIRKCTVSGCDFYPVRSGKGVRGVSNLSRIKRHCIQCSGSNIAVRECWANDCPLYVYRLGHNPGLVGKRGKGMSAEHMRRIRGLVK